MLIDAHCHLYDIRNSPNSIDKITENFEGIIINNAVDLKTSIVSIELSAKYSNVVTLMGLHPENVKDSYFEEIEEIFSLFNTKNPKIIGVGEIGLDYFYGDTKEKRKLQKLAVQMQLEFAEKNRLSVAIHSRRAKQDVLEILESYKISVHLHGFTASKTLTELAIDRGYYISFLPNSIFEKNGKRYVKRVPIKKLLLETDSPVPVNNVPATPLLLSKVRDRISNILKISPSDLEKIVEQNTLQAYPLLAKVL